MDISHGTCESLENVIHNHFFKWMEHIMHDNPVLSLCGHFTFYVTHLLQLIVNGREL